VKSVVFDAFGLENLRLTERSVEAPRGDEVEVRVHAVSLNYRDLLMVLGRYNPRLKLPLVPCSDGAGTVTAVGPEVGDLAVGDRVCSTMIPDWVGDEPGPDLLKTTLGGPVDGLLSERRVLPERCWLKIPDYLGLEEAACLPVAGLTAWSALITESGIGAGSRVLLLGTGGVSMRALGIAGAMGAEVIITSSSDEKLARARALGAHHTINYRKIPKWAAAVREIVPEGVDCVLEVGGDGTFDQSVKATRVGGMIALIGVLAEQSQAVNLTAVLMRRIRVQGILVGSRRAFTEYLAFMATTKLHPVIDRVFNGMEEARSAFEIMASGAHFGKLVIRL